MAEIPMSGHYGDSGGDGGPKRSMAPLVSVAGAVMSLALVAGTGVWGYKLLMRDVSGVPVVRAVEGPMRMAPENPGGQQADHQGLAVNSVAAEGIAAKPADRLVLAPSPIDLTQDDRAVTLANLPKVDAQAIEVAPKPETQAQAEIVAPAPLNPKQVASIKALADQIAAETAALESSDDPVETEPVKTALAEPEAKPDLPKTAPGMESHGMVNRSPRPRLRPSTASDVVLASADPKAIAAGPVVTPEENVPPGTRLVQLGAFASPEIAAAEWSKLSDRFEEILDGRTRVIQKASSGGKTFYRLRAMGFADLSDARRTCSALKAERADCIPVVAR
ncbi:SPOR domain-containing protein [Shimia biformata]|uniref:SPOR domain-containing protein n=1 Tax=Shimia biformata TaxID=1294299 RepID=UPI001952389A|nr:SPOR domain-containing protein [Shimia biformata]